MNKIIFPQIIKEYCLNFRPDNKKVWKIIAPIEKMKISKLTWQFEIPLWHSSSKHYVITPNQVLKNPKKYKKQYKRIMNANLKYPIEIMKNQKGLWEILDGLHRLVKAYLLDCKEVNVRKIPLSEIPKIRKQ